MKHDYEGWELEFFDNAKNFRKYQFSLFLNHVKGKTAEVGPGKGNNLNYYHHKTESLYLFEPSKILFDQLKKRNLQYSNTKFFNTDFSSNNERFDTIIYLDVLEHIEDDKKEFLNSYEKLNSNGSLIINVPAFNFLFSQFDRNVGHYKRYNKKNFKDFISEVTSSYHKLTYYDSIGFVLLLMSKIFFLSDDSNIGNRINFWNKLIPLSKIIDKISFFSFGKSLLFVLKK